jgi:hypothetical protein
MCRFIQSLESRRLLSATPVSKATLLADEAHIVADAVAAKADFKTLVAAVTADTKTIQSDLKGLSKSNATLLKTLKADEVKVFTLVTRDLNALIGSPGALAKRSTADGVALLTKSTKAIQAKVTADIASLGTVATAPLAKLQADDQNTGLGPALQAITDANASDATLAADITRQRDDTESKGTIFNTAVVQFQTDLGALAADLASTPPGENGGGSTLPNLVGTFNGSGTQTAGNHVGRVTGLKVNIASEGGDGSFTGTVTLTQNGQSETDSISGTVTTAGKFTGAFTDSSNVGSTLTATVSGNTIKGTYASAGGSSGTFSVTK